MCILVVYTEYVSSNFTVFILVVYTEYVSSNAVCILVVYTEYVSIFPFQIHILRNCLWRLFKETLRMHHLAIFIQLFFLHNNVSVLRLLFEIHLSTSHLIIKRNSEFVFCLIIKVLLRIVCCLIVAINSAKIRVTATLCSGIIDSNTSITCGGML